MFKKFQLITLFIAFICTHAVVGQSNPSPTKPLLDFPWATMEITTPHETHAFTVELALDKPHHAQGLMFRESLADDHGMLFMFPQDAMRSFWMRNTLISLDLLFINSSGRIVHIHENAVPLDETSMPSLAPAKAVLEVRGGLTRELDINIGDRIGNVQPIAVKGPSVASTQPEPSSPKPLPKLKTQPVNPPPPPAEDESGFWSYWNGFISWF